MSTEHVMTIVTALIRPHMEGRVVEALHGLPEFPGFFITEVRGQGRGRGAGGSYQATELDITYHRFLQLQIACRSDAADGICRAITAAAWTGRKGDGVVFTTPADSFVRIREAGGPARAHR
jgi:nitrogen regulatory protein P-II 1